MLKKRIASIMLAVVMTFTAAFFVPEIVKADENTVEQGEVEGNDNIEEISNHSNVSLNGAVGDSGGAIKAYSTGRLWSEFVQIDENLNDNYSFTHSFIEISDGTNKTVGYCAEANHNSPSGSSYTDGTTYTKPTIQANKSPYPASVAGASMFAVFAYGGTNIDPNSDIYGKSWNNQDGGSYGTYLVPNGSGGVKVVRGLMIEGEVFEMTDNEARVVSGLAVHSIIDSDASSAFGGIYGIRKAGSTGSYIDSSLWKAYVRLTNLGKLGSQYYANMAGGGIADSPYSVDTMSTVLNNFDGMAGYQPTQNFVWTIKNPSTNNWDAYTSTEKIDEKYVDANGNINIKITYTSYNMCNNLTGASSTLGNMTVSKKPSSMTINGSSANYAYFRVLEGTGNSLSAKTDGTFTKADINKSTTTKANTVPFTVEYSDIKASTTNVAKSQLFGGGGNLFTSLGNSSLTNSTNAVLNNGATRNNFIQEATITVKASDLKAEGAMFSVAVQTEVGTTYCSANKGNEKYSVQFYENPAYQDIFLCNPSRTIGGASAIYGSMEEEKGSIKIHKYSANPNITDGNSCYSLEGATFGVFKSRADAQAATNAVAVIVTDRNGNGEALDIPLGTYYVKETKASPGYRLNETIYTANITDDVPVTFNVPEEPGNDPAEVIARKKSSEGEIFIEGAVFAIKYYDIQFTENTLVDPDTLGEKPERTWYLKTGKEGYASLFFEEYILEDSDELYYTLSESPTIPVGTITIQEIEAPEGYVKDDTVYPFSITDNPTGIPSVEVMNERTIPNSPMKQPFEITKYGETKDGGKNPLAGAGFSVCKVDELKEVSKDYEPAEGEVIVTSDEGKYYIWDSSKAVVLTVDGKTELITDANGHAKSIDLEYGKYIGRETTVPATFLPVDEFTINVTKDSREAIKYEFVDKLVLTGRIDIHKTGEDRTYNEELGEFENKDIVLEGIRFEIYAAEDLYDINGNLAYASGALVETITTNNNGDAFTSDDLPLGKYRIHENVPAGYEQMKDEYVTLSRDNDTVRVTDENGAEKQIVYSVLKVKNKLLIPEIKTTAKDSVTLNNVADPSATTTSIDTISYTNLIFGKEYEIKTVLMDKESKQPLVVDGKEITATTKFKPIASAGQIDVSVTYNSLSMAGKQVVFFEYIYTDGKLVALHAEIDDDGQTITYPPETPPTPPDTPPTGDGTPLGFIIGLMVLASAGLIGMICFKKLTKKIK